MNRGSLTAAVRFAPRLAHTHLGAASVFRTRRAAELGQHLADGRQWRLLLQVSSLMVRKNSMSRRTRQSLMAHCGQLGFDDCIDPKEYFQPKTTTSKENKKARQLCRQVDCCLSLVLGDCDDPAVQSMSLVDVSPAPDSSRLLVTLSANTLLSAFDVKYLLARATLQLPRLRCEVARAIHRKRVPVLTLQVVARPGCAEGHRDA